MPMIHSLIFVIIFKRQSLAAQWAGRHESACTELRLQMQSAAAGIGLEATALCPGIITHIVLGSINDVTGGAQRKLLLCGKDNICGGCSAVEEAHMEKLAADVHVLHLAPLELHRQLHLVALHFRIQGPE